MKKLEEIKIRKKKKGKVEKYEYCPTCGTHCEELGYDGFYVGFYCDVCFAEIKAK